MGLTLVGHTPRQQAASATVQIITGHNVVTLTTQSAHSSESCHSRGECQPTISALGKSHAQSQQRELGLLLQDKVEPASQKNKVKLITVADLKLRHELL